MIKQRIQISLHFPEIGFFERFKNNQKQYPNPSLRSATLLKRDSDTGVFMCILRNF